MCSDWFPDYQRVATHLANKHKARNPARLWAHHAQCPSCLVHYQHRSRMVDHLKSSRRNKSRLDCYAKLVANIPPLSRDEELALTKEEASGDARCAAGRSVSEWKPTDVPSTQAEGPKPRWASTSEAPLDALLPVDRLDGCVASCAAVESEPVRAVLEQFSSGAGVGPSRRCNPSAVPCAVLGSIGSLSP